MEPVGNLTMKANRADVLEQQANADLMEQKFWGMNIPYQGARDKEARDKGSTRPGKGRTVVNN